jgi:hypothetical protein
MARTKRWASWGLVLGTWIVDGGMHRAALPWANCDPRLDPSNVLAMSGQTWVMPWSEIESYARTLTFDLAHGERNHVLRPLAVTVIHGDTTPVSASIYADITGRPASLPAAGSPAERALILKGQTQLACGRITAMVTSNGRFGPLALASDTNYFMVWRDRVLTPSPKWGKWHIYTLNKVRRAAIAYPFDYKVHGAVTLTSGAPDRRPVLSVAALQCRSSGLTACFVDSKTEHIAPLPSGTGSGAPGIGVGADPIPPDLFHSQGWTSCVIYGCCCGGLYCH